MFPSATKVLPNQKTSTTGNNILYNRNGCHLEKRINDEKDVIHFKSKSEAHKNIVTYIELLCERIKGTGNKVFNFKYSIKNDLLQKCSEFLESLMKCCQETDLQLAKSAGTLRFGHVAFRDWHDVMCEKSREFVCETLCSLSGFSDEISNKSRLNQFKEELIFYLTESFGNKMRIDYGTGHELNFIIFTMGLCNLVDLSTNLNLSTSNEAGDSTRSIEAQDLTQGFQGGRILEPICEEKLKLFVNLYGFDIHKLFSKFYLKLCRQVQLKFRLEPAGSRGVYNMDDFQFLPYLFGSAQLVGLRYVPIRDFYMREQVDQFKDDFIFFEAIDFILDNKRGPFNEHSYTLWNFTNLCSWDNIYRKIRVKFNELILTPFPIVQHILFGQFILRWESNNHQLTN